MNQWQLAVAYFTSLKRKTGLAPLSIDFILDLPIENCQALEAHNKSQGIIEWLVILDAMSLCGMVCRLSNDMVSVVARLRNDMVGVVVRLGKYVVGVVVGLGKYMVSVGSWLRDCVNVGANYMIVGAVYGGYVVAEGAWTRVSAGRCVFACVVCDCRPSVCGVSIYPRSCVCGVSIYPSSCMCRMSIYPSSCMCRMSVYRCPCVNENRMRNVAVGIRTTHNPGVHSRR